MRLLFKGSNVRGRFYYIFQDKVLVSNGPHNEGIQVTNDGATILKSIGVDNPAAKVLVGKLKKYYLTVTICSI